MGSTDEKTKMLSGQLYDATDPVLAAERLAARELLHRINVTEYGDLERRNAALRALLPRCPPDLWIEPPFYCDYGYNITCGARVYFNFNCVVLDAAAVTIGSDVLFGPAVQVYAATHPVGALERREWLELAKPVTVGSDCWIGGGAIICPGVTIGDGCVIAAGAVVTRDVPADSIAKGNPARFTPLTTTGAIDRPGP